MTMSENEVVMALSQKVAQLERRLETVAKLHMALAEKYEGLRKDCDVLSSGLIALEAGND